jgi:hypothetical protein
MQAWLIPLSPIISLVFNVLAQMISAHVTGRIGFSILVGLVFGLLIELLLLSRVPFGESASIGTLSYLAFSFCFWAFLNLNLTSLRIRLLRELFGQPHGLAIEHLKARYSPEEIVARRIERLQKNGQIITHNGKWALASRTLLIFVYVSTLLRKLIIPKREYQNSEKRK